MRVPFGNRDSLLFYFYGAPFRPRFPWFWPAAADPGFDEHQAAFQAALGMRYRFLPFMYSLAHGAHREGKPIAHPASFAFPPVEGDRAAAAVAAQYMVGGVLIPSDLGLAHTNARPPPLENTSLAHLPGTALSWPAFHLLGR